MRKNSTPRKLTLSRETLRNLADEPLRDVDGGQPSISTCPSCGIACTVARLTCTCTAE